MKFLSIALIFLVCVLLIVSLTYIIVSTRHKEKMVLLEQGKDAHKIMNDHFIPNTLRFGFLFLGVGLGFLIAMILDEFLLYAIDNPAIYAGCVLTCGGISQLIFYKVYARKLIQNNQEL